MIPSAAAAIVLMVAGIAVYSSSVSVPRVAWHPPLPAPVVPPPANPPPDEVASLFAMTTQTTSIPELDAIAEGPGVEQDAAHDDHDSKPSHEDGGYKAVFDIPLDAGQ